MNWTPPGKGTWGCDDQGQVRRHTLTLELKTHPSATGLLLLLLLGWFPAFLATAEVTNREPQAVTLADARRVAFERNWDLLAAKSDVDLSTAARLVSHEMPNPTLSLSSTKITVDDHPSSTTYGNALWSRSYDTTAAINQLFEIGGKRRARQAGADAGVKASQARFADARRVLDLAVTRAYVAVVQAEASARVLRASADSLRRESEIAATRLQAGDIARTEKQQIEIASTRFQLDSQSADAAAAGARIALQTLLGVPQPDGAFAAAETLEALADAAIQSASIADASSTGAMGTRPDLLAAEAGVSKAESDLRLQKAMRIPDPTLMMMYEHEPPDLPNTVGFGISFPLPLWNRNRGAIAAATAAREQAITQREKTRGQIHAEIAVARVTYLNAVHRWQDYRTQLQPKSDEIRKTIALAYEKGGASLLDLMSAERNDNDVRLAATQAAADAVVVAAALSSALNLSTPAPPVPNAK